MTDERIRDWAQIAFSQSHNSVDRLAMHARSLIAEVRREVLEASALACQEISTDLRQSALNARHRGDQKKYASLHRKRNGVIACIAAIRQLAEREGP
jgi:hypothetical protein